MKRMLALFLSCTMLLTGCTVNSEISSSTESTTTEMADNTKNQIDLEYGISSENITEATHNSNTDAVSSDIQENVDTISFMTLNDPELLRYVEDSVYSELVNQLNSDDYIVESIQAMYMPEEYYAEVEFNSQENIYFGYKSSELDEIFQGTKYVFTLDENGFTTVQEMEVLNDDTYDKIVKNVAIGAGVILVCVTVSVVSVGVGAPDVIRLFFAASAKTATTFARSSSVLGGISAAFVKGVETRNVKETMKAAALGASDGFKWGAISGAVVGGASESYKLYKSGKAVTNAVSGVSPIEIGRAGEMYAQEFYKGETQLSYLAGEEVAQFTPGATRPDIVIKNANGAIEAIEVKNYDLVNNLSGLKKELERQVSSRVINLPEGSTQRIALVTKGRGYSKEFTKGIVEELQTYLFDVYGGKIPIDIL